LAFTLTLFLVLSFAVQSVLLFWHEEFAAMQGWGEEDRPQSGEDQTGLEGVTDGIGGSTASDTLTNAQGSRAILPSGGGIVSGRRFSPDPADILKRAGFDSSNDADDGPPLALPTGKDATDLYGDQVRIVGLEKCAAYREKVKPDLRVMGPAGLFNTATNLLKSMLKLNCVNRDRMRSGVIRYREGVAIQAPWGKHNPVSWRGQHEAHAGGMSIARHGDFLPVLMVKDPVTWMSSMCRHPYEARWMHHKEHCPNLVPNVHDKGKHPDGVMHMKVKFATFHIGDEPQSKNKTFINYDSLVDFWNKWYTQWTTEPDFPFLVVRFEDLLFRAEETVSAVCDCAGFEMRPKFRYVEDSAKGQGGPHKGSAGLASSLARYANGTLREETLTGPDQKFAKEHLDGRLMEMFGYSI